MSETTRLRGPPGWAIDRVFDRPALWGILRLWLPTSRLWAAAMAARGDIDRFLAEVPLATPPARDLRKRLATFEARRRTYEDAAAAWEDALFGEASTAARSQAEKRRAHAALALTAQRLRFLDLVPGRRIPASRFEVPTPSEFAATYGASLHEPWRLYTPSTVPVVAVSGRVPTRHGEDYWLRFPSPSARVNDIAWARVYQPRGVVDPPTVIFGNGVFVEFDHLGTFSGGIAALRRQGVRIIEIEAPWHGRRRQPGRYGGEPFLGTAPLGPLDLFTAQAQELAVLVDWCRRTSRGAVAVAGASMGSLAAGLAASHAPHWPESMRPDALALLTAADELVGLSARSTLTRGIGLTDALHAAGWSDAALRPWHALGALAEHAPLPPERIVAVLGTRDSILPYAAGRTLATRWRLRPENLFVTGGGHFTAQLAVALDPRPLRRLCEVLRQLNDS